jgi:hypothetical protein
MYHYPNERVQTKKMPKVLNYCCFFNKNLKRPEISLVIRIKRKFIIYL